MLHARCDRIWPVSWLFALVVLLVGVASPATADVAVFTQPPNAAGGQYKSSWYAPDGLDNDEYVWDAFTLPSDTAITQIHWRGAYTNYLSGAGTSPVYNFYISIYSSIGGGSQPSIGSGPLVQYEVGGNAGETPAGSAGGYAMYDYAYTLPSPFQATGGVKYWVQIEAWQGVTPIYYWPPDWSLARGTGGENSHFRKIGGTGGMYAFITGDCAFSLYASSLPGFTISASVSPAGAGTVTGAGVYPTGSAATLIATPAHGFGFVDWTEGASRVSTNPTYAFVVNANRSLVANFVPAYIVTTASLPTYGGTTTGDGTYNDGTTVTVTATPAPGFAFAGWTEYGSPVSPDATYAFLPTADSPLVATFVNAPGSYTFDFDNAPVHTSLPVALSSGAMSAVFSGTDAGFSIQAVGTVGISPPGFSGLCIYPNSVFRADLVADFSRALTDFSVLYSTQELGCDSSARMRVTAYLDGVQVGTATTTAPNPGTWPSATLSIHVSTAGGFNHAVVHYDAAPPTCHDYGVIFMADNVTVTELCDPASVVADPTPATTCADGSALFSVAALGTAPNFQWQWRSGPDWIDLADGVIVVGDVPTLLVFGAQQPNLFTRMLTPTDGAVRCVVTNACSTATSAAATLSVKACAYGVCIADYNGSGGTPDASDIDAFFADWLAGVECADADCSGGTPDTNDIDVFFTLWLAGGC